MRKLIVLLFLLGMVLMGCNTETSESNGDGSSSDNESIKIYATLYPLAYFAEEIGGELVDVETILPAGADPHSYEPTSKMMVDIAASDLFLFNGANLESYAGEIEEALKDEDVSMVEAADGVTSMEHSHSHEEESEHEHEHEESEHTESTEDGHNHGDVDPHLWLDPVRAIEMARNIKDALVSQDPDNEEFFTDNFNQLESKLTELDESFHKQLEQAASHQILVTHAAYGYWEQSYHIEQIALTGLSPSEEPSQKELEQIIDHVKETDINYLLFEQNVEPKVAQVIQSETNLESLELHNLSVLTEEDIENNETYFTLMERNLEVLTKALND
ncbi:zinc ABC transporter substrate-binding protein [Gracilibacillus caseinilyticus]|uniref:Zinc ABC transporter substrate-binding protein n=1 Tax=Gracilibacillus caseinilyticus TaxID=2932256 RepID=A0ABY4ETD1_9BACI|nr:zinc ABC transporter substrate-binding protein [Gracilibacillus caseinilyticus]UOQ47012.1 zinc ABC transporter substrate-binding protein [Gracilibacillus caseinilyticus]